MKRGSNDEDSIIVGTNLYKLMKTWLNYGVRSVLHAAPLVYCITPLPRPTLLTTRAQDSAPHKLNDLFASTMVHLSQMAATSSCSDRPWPNSSTTNDTGAKQLCSGFQMLCLLSSLKPIIYLIDLSVLADFLSQNRNLNIHYPLSWFHRISVSLTFLEAFESH